jgi:hypothetical protein
VQPSDERQGHREAKATDEPELTRFMLRKHAALRGLQQTRNEVLKTCIEPPEINVPIKRLTLELSSAL